MTVAEKMLTASLIKSQEIPSQMRGNMLASCLAPLSSKSSWGTTASWENVEGQIILVFMFWLWDAKWCCTVLNELRRAQTVPPALIGFVSLNKRQTRWLLIIHTFWTRSWKGLRQQVGTWTFVLYLIFEANRAKKDASPDLKICLPEWQTQVFLHLLSAGLEQHMFSWAWFPDDRIKVLVWVQRGEKNLVWCYGMWI